MDPIPTVGNRRIFSSSTAQVHRCSGKRSMNCGSQTAF